MKLKPITITAFFALQCMQTLAQKTADSGKDSSESSTNFVEIYQSVLLTCGVLIAATGLWRTWTHLRIADYHLLNETESTKQKIQALEARIGESEKCGSALIQQVNELKENQTKFNQDFQDRLREIHTRLLQEFFDFHKENALSRLNEEEKNLINGKTVKSLLDILSKINNPNEVNQAVLLKLRNHEDRLNELSQRLITSPDLRNYISVLLGANSFNELQHSLSTHFETAQRSPHLSPR